MTKYEELLRERYEGKMLDYSGSFFAFSEEQLEQGMAKIGVTDKNLIYAGFTKGPLSGLCGTEEGLNRFWKSFKLQEQNFKDRVQKECTPQEVYDYEFQNYECGVIWDDEEAYNATVRIYGKEVVDVQVKRRCRIS